MPNVLKHGFVSAVSDEAAAGRVKPSHWNSEHAFDGGATDDLLVFDSTLSDKAKWLSPGKIAALNVYNVKHPTYGALGDGATDDTAAIQAAITAARAASGGIIYFPPGDYRTSSAINVVGLKGIHLRGSGRRATKIRTTSTTANTFRFGDGGTTLTNSVSIAHLSVEPVNTQTAGSGISIDHSGITLVDDVAFEGGFIGCTVNGTGSADVFISRCTFATQINTGLVFTGNSSNSKVSDCRFFTTGSEPAQAHLRLRYCHGIFFTAIEINDGRLYIDPQNGEVVSACFFDSVTVDSAAVTGINCAPSGTGLFEHSNFVNCWAVSCTGHGVQLNTGCSAISFVGCQFLGNTQHGFLISGGTHIHVNGCRASGNSAGSSNTDSGFAVAANVNKFSFEACTSAPVASYSNTQRNGLLVATGTSDEYVIVGNWLRGNATAALSDNGSGANKVVGSNLT